MKFLQTFMIEWSWDVILNILSVWNILQKKYHLAVEENKKEFTYHQQSFSQQEGEEGVLSKNIAIKRTITAPDKKRDPVWYYQNNVDGDICEGFVPSHNGYYQIR